MKRVFMKHIPLLYMIQEPIIRLLSEDVQEVEYETIRRENTSGYSCLGTHDEGQDDNLDK
jgi:hypothetical protein